MLEPIYLLHLGLILLYIRLNKIYKLGGKKLIVLFVKTVMELIFQITIGKLNNRWTALLV